MDLVFSDVWGPAPTSVGRNNYYVSFIDDYSKFTWIYFLRHKSEVFQCFRNFQNLVERQFGRKILAIQTDWVGEYQALHSFFQRIGIEHHVSCPHAHQQNGSAERKHRHIVEMGLTLLAHSSLLLKFWDEAFSTAVFLINRLPSRVIHGETPLERLYKQKPDYSFFRTFGCAVWPNLRPYNARKLQFRSKQCVFLGYSNLHKGFKCLDPKEGRIYISRDVVFDEHVFPFASLHSNAGARLRAEFSLLPDILKNPSSTFGDALLHDQHLVSPTNPSPSFGLSSDDATGTNPAQEGSETAPGHRHFMCSPHSNSTRCEGDMTATADGLPSASTSGSVGQNLPTASPAQTQVPAPSPGSSAADTPPHVAVDGSFPTQTDPLAPGTTSGTESLAILSPGSSTASESGGTGIISTGVDSLPAPAPSPPHRPVTRAQHGISKPKIYTDGTIR